MNRKLLFLIAGISILVTAASFHPFCTKSTNCGGNSAALSDVSTIVDVARVETFDAPDHSFRFDRANADDRRLLVSCSNDPWVRGARFLVTTTPVLQQEAQPRRIIVVCDTPYRNVPRQRFGSAPPTHAAGFADGSTGLISTADFAALDRSTFVPLDELLGPKPK